MDILYVSKVISKVRKRIWIHSPREMAPVYVLPGTERRWYDKRFTDHRLAFHIDEEDVNNIKSIDETYDFVKCGNYMLKDVTIVIIQKNEDNTYLVYMKADDVAVLNSSFEIEEGRSVYKEYDKHDDYYNIKLRRD